jgi:nucleoside-diphosphate-sugar epimerase
MDISKAKKLLGYSPKINVFDGIKKTCVWAQQNW